MKKLLLVLFCLVSLGATSQGFPQDAIASGVADQTVMTNRPTGCNASQPTGTLSFWSDGVCSPSYISLTEGTGYDPYSIGGNLDSNMLYSGSQIEPTAIGFANDPNSDDDFKLKTSDVQAYWQYAYVKVRDLNEDLEFKSNVINGNYVVQYQNGHSPYYTTIVNGDSGTISASNYYTVNDTNSVGMTSALKIRFRKNQITIRRRGSGKVSPNPARTGDNVTLYSEDKPEFDEAITVSLYDMSGRLVKESTVGSNLEFNYRGVIKGVYLLRARGNKGYSFNESVVVE